MGLFGKGGAEDNAAASDQRISEGHALEDRGQWEAALAKYHEALRLHPDSFRAHLNIGNAQLALGRDREAVASYRAALRLKPDYVSAHVNLGRYHYRERHFADAAASYSAALRADPNYVDAHVGLGLSLEELQRVEEALAAYRQALAIQPDHPGSHLNLGRLLMRLGETDAATTHLEAALHGLPDNAHAHWWLGKLYKDMGFLREAVSHLRRACTIEPQVPDFRGLLLFTLTHDPDITPTQLLAEHREYDRLFTALHRPPALHYANLPDPERRLRIGYVSGDLRNHPVARFIEPVLAHHDRARFEIHAFCNHDQEDAVTARLRQLADQWHRVAMLDDPALAALIRELGIDLLVDLSGHTERHRLQVFARRPAPLQYTWLGYLNTTGLTAMDYRLCDVHTDPPGLTEVHHSEQLARLPASQWCHAPYDNLPPVAGLPLARHGRPTLGSFNNVGKLNDRVIALWAEVLRAVPSAQLRIAAAPAGRAQERLVTLFAGQGVARERIEFLPRSGYRDYLAAISEVDIALDPFPYNGGTTTLDALVMGVPVVTLAGARSIARGGVSLLTNAGVSECIAQTSEEYVTIIERLVADPVQLASLRARLRSGVQGSILQDGRRFTNDLENLFREHWRAWCARQKKPA